MDYSNISTMLAQLTGQSAYAGKNISSVTDKQAAEVLLKNMEPGQIFSGEITDIRGSYITITLQNMQSVQARLAENFEFLIGQKALFQVKDNQDSQLLIRPLDLNAAQSGELMVAERALSAAGLQMTEKTLELVKNLMAANQPIDKQSILSYVRQLAKYPQAEISDLITLHKHQLPVNGETVSQMANYRQFEHSLLKDIGELQQKLPDIVGELSKESPERALALLKGIVTALLPKQDGAVQSQDALGNAGQTTEGGQQAAIADGVLQEDRLAEAAQNGKTGNAQSGVPAEGALTGAEHTQNAAQAQSSEQSALMKLADMLKDSEVFLKPEGRKALGEALKNTLEEAFLLKPEEVADKEKVKEYYKGMQEKGDALKELFQTFGKETAVLDKPVQNMTQNLQFMQTLNEAFNYIQLPLKMTNQEAHGDLYVYTRKKAKGNAEEGLSAFLHLDMEYLGSVDVMVKLTGQRVGTDFTLETEELLDFIEQHMELLTARLEKKGYQCSTQVTLKNPEEPQQSFEQKLTGETAVAGDIRRFSFDVRA